MQQVAQVFLQLEAPVAGEALQSHELESSVQSQCMHVQLPEEGNPEPAQQKPFSEVPEQIATSDGVAMEPAKHIQ